MKNSVSEKEYQYKIRAGRVTDKESLLQVLQLNYERSSSLDDFYSKLNKSKIETYQRSGKVTGVVFNGKKFRFSRLGISLELFQETSVERKRNNELKASRDLKKKEHKELNL
ncbi:MAG: hypothetical protein IPJ66_19385 [Bacteroidetes bacterium]|nr:hypothetical protein [Bacteroidota bacterium]MBL0065212.1 hypothetical protein [Bacteroidota bacterium]MBL0138394.1 hypothetical protein [Bacteroidota bacterium]